MPSSEVVPLEIIGDEVESQQPTELSCVQVIVGCAQFIFFGLIASCIVIVLFLVVLCIPFFFMIEYTITTEPCLSIESIIPVTSINVTYAQNPSSTSPLSSITGSWNVSFGLYNRAHAKITYYDGFDVTLYYRNVSIGHTTIHISKIHQGRRKTWIHMATRIDTESARLDDMVAYGLARDINDGTIRYAVEVVAHAGIMPNWRFGRKSTLKFDSRDTLTDFLHTVVYRSCFILPS